MNLRSILDVGGAFEAVINWLTENMDPLFDSISVVIKSVLNGFTAALVYPHPFIIIVLFGALIFSLPPAVRLTNLGIRQVLTEIKEACRSFGSSPSQMLFKAELPVALPTIMAGVNQTIMLALSMVVIAGMIGAGGLGNEVLKGITQLKIDLGFESGISIVILAIFLDRVTQALGEATQKQR